MIDDTPASEKSLDSDDIADRGAKKFIDMLRKIGPHSK
jgi:lipoate synthase